MRDAHTITYPDAVRRIAASVRDAGGRAFVVGGCIRDLLLGLPPGDADFEVYGLPLEKLLQNLASIGRTELVGKSFGVLKVTVEGHSYDVAIPRTERKTAPGHRGFDTSVAPDLEPATACRRRDLTVNALMHDPLTGELFDHVGGLRDLEFGVLRHISPAFGEDPLRALRVAQLAARLRFAVAPETIEMARHLDLSELPRERLFGEFQKLLLLATAPSWGLEVLRLVGGLRIFPELEALIDCPQEPRFHPEGDVWTHTRLCLDRAAPLRRSSPKPLELMLAVLCHDLGKPLTTVRREDRLTSYRHEAEGEQSTRRFLDRLTTERDFIERVTGLVRHHLAPVFLYERRDEVKDGTIRRLAARLDLHQLVLVAMADHGGRCQPDDGFPAGSWLLERATALSVTQGPPRPVLQGRHLLELGLAPGPHIGRIIRYVYEHQLDGTVQTLSEALELVRAQLARNPLWPDAESPES
ncbi:MAG: HD domain-containing protein [Planctomycetota bacterium]